MAKGLAKYGMPVEGISRREFLRNGSLSCATLGASISTLATPARTPASPRVRSVILLWMDGGPSPYETFAPPSSTQASPGPFGAIPSRVPDLSVSELMPRMAGWMNRATLYRALRHSEGSHAGAAHLALTGRVQHPEETHLTLGEVLTRRSGTRLAQSSPAEPAPHLALSEPTPRHSCGVSVPSPGSARTARRHALATHFPAPAPTLHPAAHGAATQAVDLVEACRTARKQVEAGAAFVQVTCSGWDAHSDLAGTYTRLVPQLDQAFSTLLRDLDDRSMLEETLVVWMGEFGRSPQINALGGRDHWPYAGCAVLFGGGCCGQVFGEVDAHGYPTAGAVTPAELLDEIYARAGCRSEDLKV